MGFFQSSDRLREWPLHGERASFYVGFRQSGRSSGRVIFVDLALITGSLLLLVGLIAALGGLGFGTGLNVPPTGEDLNWVDMLRRGGGGSEVARIFWDIDSRNPLSPWWYIAAQHLILGPDWGLLLLRFSVALLLAWAAYAVVVTVAGPSWRAFGVGLGIAIVFWMANRYQDQIFWNFQGALALSLISIAAYAYSLNSRYGRLYYSMSLATFFAALATYTVQCGAVLAIGYLAFRKAPGPHYSDSRVSPLVQRVAFSLRETAPYLLMFAFFLLIWRTTMHSSHAGVFSLQPSIGRFLDSIVSGVWSIDFTIFARRLTASPYRVVYAIAAAICGIIVAFVLLHGRLRFPQPFAYPFAQRWKAMDLLAIAGAVAAPTVVLETASTLWTPGTRWPMISQFTTPFFFIMVAGIIAAALPRRIGRWVWATGVGFLVGTGALFTLAHNRLQVDISEAERFARQHMQRVAAEDFLLGRNPPLQFLLVLDPSYPWSSLDTISDVLARVWLEHSGVSFRLMPRQESRLTPWYDSLSSALESWWVPRFLSDEEGVDNARVWGGAVSYENVRLLRLVNGEKAQRITSATEEDLAGWLVSWERTEPVQFPRADQSELCPLHWTADLEVLGRSWSVAERDPDSRPFRWTVGRRANIVMPNVCGQPKRIKVEVAHAVSAANLDGLSILLGGTELQWKRQQGESGILYEAEVPAHMTLDDPVFDVSLQVPRLDQVPGDPRRFGVAVRSIDLSF